MLRIMLRMMLRKMQKLSGVFRTYASFIFLFLLIANDLSAQSRGYKIYDEDPRGEVDLVVCSQNLENYGLFDDAKKRNAKLSKDDYTLKNKALVKRFAFNKCDVIAFQELLGNENNSKEAIKKLGKLLANNTGRVFNYYLARSNDKYSRVGFLVAKDRAEVLDTVSYSRVELPKLIEGERPRFFTRGPFEIQLKVKARGKNKTKKINIITFHFKSKSGGFKDPAKTNWEILRMQSAEALRSIVENRFKKSLIDGEQILILLGDRNADLDSASARILKGTHTLSMFSGKAPCRLSKKGVPLCQSGVVRPPVFVSVLTDDAETSRLQGTYMYQNTYSWVDDILVAVPSLPFTWENFAVEGNYNSGISDVYPQASDHSLSYVKINF